MSDPNAARIRESFGKQSLMTTFGAQIDHVERGSVTISSPIGENALQQQGFAHAGLTFALGDSAAGYAALTMLPADQEVVTAEIKINLLSPGRGARLRATGRVVKAGRRMVVVTSEVFAQGEDGAETCIAVLQGTMVPVPASAPV
ncbi:PaaI family thioesterase [Aliishimia ponticola]|uniref:Medium/long-chain acyl-CoA thioesterase YigI n=1 Tax=Aliishimia ponticola TaxID=2499833 RepID=A0A4S4NCQ3_9RHOB|nr:PaaI family thioesterase [Aliishimia ponticola]THH37226.1 PaaI family thioesterase [Aliishimia ponticola]